MTEAPLLDPDEPGPVSFGNEAGGAAFFLTCDHGGRAIPRRLDRLGIPEPETFRHIAWDIGIAAVGRLLSARLDAALIVQGYSRLVIDCNRDPSWPAAMPEVSEYTPVPGNVGLSAEARAARVAAIFTPYHDRIRGLLDARSHRRTVLVAMHSFTPSFKGENRAMEVGMLYNKDARLAGILLDLLCQEDDLVVGDNAPYAITDDSDYSVPTHGEQRGLAHVEVEIRQDLIATSAGQEAWAQRFARLLTAAGSILQTR
jgi:predicted N-formylglutamate amidohydrolase